MVRNKMSNLADTLFAQLEYEVARMNQDGLFASDADITRVGIGYTKLKNKIIEVKRNG